MKRKKANKKVEPAREEGGKRMAAMGGVDVCVRASVSVCCAFESRERM